MDMSADGTGRMVLASASPRRRELVSAFVPPFTAVAPEVDETPRSGESPEDLVLRLSLEKARWAAGRAGAAAVLGADTVVVLDGEVLGKPDSPQRATNMLARLRGRTHRVVTGVTALDGRSGRWLASAKTSHVTMREYTDAEVAAYVASGDPMDKAGAYAVQNDSFRPAAGVDGCYLNVVGLPLCEVVTLMKDLGSPVRLRDGWRPPSRCVDCALAGRGEVDSS